MHCDVYLLVLVQLMVKVLSKNFRDCQMKHIARNQYVLQNRISSHLCLNKDMCILSLTSLMKYFSIVNGKLLRKMPSLGKLICSKTI